MTPIILCKWKTRILRSPCDYFESCWENVSFYGCSECHNGPDSLYQVGTTIHKQDGAWNSPSVGRKPSGKHQGRRDCQALHQVRVKNFQFLARLLPSYSHLFRFWSLVCILTEFLQCFVVWGFILPYRGTIGAVEFLVFSKDVFRCPQFELGTLRKLICF